MASLNEAFDTVADTDVWEDAAATMAGFLAPSVARNVIEPNSPFDAPDELYGVLVMAGGQASPAYSHMITLGGATYTVDKLLERANVKQRVTSLGAGGS